MKILLGLLVATCAFSVCQADIIKVSPGTDGDVITSRLYSVD